MFIIWPELDDHEHRTQDTILAGLIETAELSRIHSDVNGS